MASTKYGTSGSTPNHQSSSTEMVPVEDLKNIAKLVPGEDLKKVQNPEYGTSRSTLSRRPSMAELYNITTEDLEKIAKRIPVEDLKKAHRDFLDISDDGGLEGLKSLYFTTFYPNPLIKEAKMENVVCSCVKKNMFHF